MKKIPLNERIKKARSGECTAGADLGAFKTMIRQSASVPVSRMCSEGKLKLLKENFYYCRAASDTVEFPETYGELAHMIDSSRKRAAGGGYAPDRAGCLPDKEWNLFCFLWLVYIAESFRRINPAEYKRSYAEDYPDISKEFPAFCIPLPYLYKAAAWRCKDRQLKESLKNIYSDEFAPFIKDNPNTIARKVKECLEYQPDKNTYYSDSVTMINTINYARNSAVASENDAEDLVYDIVITPFLI